MQATLKDKTYLGLTGTSAISSVVAFYFLWQFIVKNAGVWTATEFIPIYDYIVVIFVINAILGLVAYKKDRFLALAFCFATISINILILVALILNIRNPNG